MGVKSGCIVVAALILIHAMFLSGCIDQDAWRSGISEEENQRLQDQPEELKNNQSTSVPKATTAQTTNESPVEKLKREQAESKLTPTPVPATSEPTPIDTAQYTPVTTTPPPALIPTPTLTPVLAPTATLMSTPDPISTPEKIWSFRTLSLSNFYHYIENQ